MIRFSPNPNRAHLIHWSEWGEEAFQEARKQDKPLMLYLGAFWCGFCHRMDEGAFSSKENIALLNFYFIPVRVENAKRPDIDVRYNHNGWPTIAFMTPQGYPLATANYLPPAEFENLLVRVLAGYQKKNGGTQDELPGAHPEGSRKIPNRVLQGKIRGSGVSEISNLLMELADRVHGGYGRGQKFLHPEANDFLLCRYETTGDSRYLEHVSLTLDRIRESPVHDLEEGGYYRTCSREDWSEPHREKLLVDQSGLLANCLRAFRITKRPVYGLMAEGIIDYLNRKLSDLSGCAFYGCQDYIRATSSGDPSETFFSIRDECVYADANARTVVAYLEASWILGRSDCKERALKALSFLWDHCLNPGGGMFHYFDGIPQIPGLLSDQVHMGTAILQAYRATGEAHYLERAKELAEFILVGFTNPAGGYYDLRTQGSAFLRFRLTLMEENGAAASFFLKLAEATKERRYRKAALWALSAFTGDFRTYGIHAAGFGQALADFVNC